MATGADMAQPDSRLGDRGTDGTGNVRPRNGGADMARPYGSSGTVSVVAAGDNGRMEMVDSTPRPQKWKPSDSVYVRLSRAQDDVKTITKDATIELKKDGKKIGEYKGVSSPQIVTYAKRALLDNGLVFIPHQTKDDFVINGNMTSVYVCASFVCVDNDGSIEVGGWGSGADFSDKAHSKAYTNAVKNILSKTLMMSTLEDESDEATPHEPDHKPKAVRNAEALTDVAIKTWADAFKSAIDGCKTLQALKKVRAENAHMMTNPGVPQITKDYFVDKITALEGTLE